MFDEHTLIFVASKIEISYKEIKALAEHLGKDPTNYHAHSLRATAACNKYHETNDLLLVKAFLGHRQVAMTEQYTGNLNVIG